MRVWAPWEGSIESPKASAKNKNEIDRAKIANSQRRPELARHPIRRRDVLAESMYRNGRGLRSRFGRKRGEKTGFYCVTCRSWRAFPAFDRQNRNNVCDRYKGRSSRPVA